MNENLLQYLWKYKIFSKIDFKDSDGNPLEILDFGKFNKNSGPDFSLAKIKTKNIVLAGNVEIHVKSSDWYFHHHDTQKDYQSVILHVVYFNDVDVSELKNAGIPTLELKDYIDDKILSKYQSLENHFDFIPCESIFEPKKIPFLFSEETLLKKLDEKSIEIEHLLNQSKNNYEAVLFQKIAYSFGLKVNAEIYQNIALCRTEEDIQNVIDEIIDRYGHMPSELENLIEIARIKNLCRVANVIKISQRKEKVVFYFDKAKFNPEIVDKLIKKYNTNIRFSTGIEPYVTVTIGSKIIEEIKEFLTYIQNCTTSSM